MTITAYVHFTQQVPDFGGSLAEGFVGAPKQINPLLAQANDIDRDISELVYSGLTKYNSEGTVALDLAESYEVSDDGLVYTFKLKDGLVWHDGQPLTADDVVFTILTVQNPDYNSPQVFNWSGVEVSKVDAGTISFKLKNKYAQFLNNTSLGIIPKHIWEGVKSVNFSFSEFNIKPVGSGPYKFEKFRRDEFGNIKSYSLESFSDYYAGQPFIDNITFKFYLSEKEAVDALNDGDIDSLVVSNQQIKFLKFRQKLFLNNLQLPRYFSIFLNQNQSDTLAQKDVRMALNYATDRDLIIKNVLNEYATAVTSPILSGILSINLPENIYNFDREKAGQLLDKSGWVYPEAEGEDESLANYIRQKAPSSSGSTDESSPARLSIKLTTSDWPELVEVANEIKKQWEAVGVGVEIQVLPLAELQQAIRNRDYQALLFGEVLNLDPDPFSFWHSSQKKDPGLNLALYDNKEADKLLEEARQTIDKDGRNEKYEEFQVILLSDAPAIFLYSPYFIYVQSTKVKSNNTKIISVPSDRFSSVNAWYMDTKRVRRQN